MQTNNSQVLEPWNIKQLKDAYDKSLMQCTDSFERNMCKAIGGKEIREKALEWNRQRKLTPFELAIAEEFGFKQ